MNKNETRGCFGTFIGCLSAGIVFMLIISAVLYFTAPSILKNLDRKIMPWLESKGRVIIGKMALQPISITIQQSGLSKSEKKKWKKFLSEKWELANSSQDKKLSREYLINAGRKTVASYSGTYYALLAINKRDFKETTLTDKQISMAKKLITNVTEDLLHGVYSVNELQPLRTDLYSVMTGWRVDTSNGQKTVHDKNLRGFSTHLTISQEHPYTMEISTGTIWQTNFGANFKSSGSTF
jgi:hypothetical protein